MFISFFCSFLFFYFFFSYRRLAHFLKQITGKTKEKGPIDLPLSTCANCGGTSAAVKAGMIPKLKKCAGCESVVFCSGACQKAAWKRHKKTCREIIRMKNNAERE